MANIKLRISLILVGALGVVGGGVAVGAGTLAAPHVGAFRAHVSSAPVDLAAAFSGLKRERTATDQLPTDALAAITDAQQRFGADPSQSRRVLSSPSGSLWVVPGHGILCEVIELASGAVSVACTPASVAVAHGMVGSYGHTLLGVLPNGGSLTVTRQDGSTATAAANADGAFQIASTSTSTSFRYSAAGSSQARLVVPPVPAPAGGLPQACDQSLPCAAVMPGAQPQP